MSIEIPAEFLPWIQNAVARGSYKSESAVIGEALRLLQQRDEEVLKAVQGGFDEIERGECIEINGDEELREFFEDIKIRGRARVAL